ncbi:MAG TPA: class I SAM-dependent methyltransferase [Novosphingobium sp.]|nr:class I SAM-dependent methyltransferase [Novosphingobium sp.]
MRRRRDRLEPLRRIARAVPGGIAAGRWLRRQLSPELRALERLRREHSGALFQPYATTAEDRYPQLFDALAQRLAHLPAPRILSFGCSTGEEVRALRARLPNARITGIDLNPRSLAIARKNDTDPLSYYRLAGAPLPGDRFDAVLAMAVFRHGVLEAEQPVECSAVLPFARFAEGVALLDTSLEPGGWLALYNSHFRFSDTPTSAGYACDPLRMTDHRPRDLLYGPDNQRLLGVTDNTVLFRKLA